MFDAVVISGEVGMRKPEPRDLPARCSTCWRSRRRRPCFVDDLPRTSRAAPALGLVGVHHTSYDETAAELEVLFGLRRCADVARPAVASRRAPVSREEQRQPDDGVGHHQRQQRELADHGAPAGEAGDGPVVGEHDAERRAR